MACSPNTLIPNDPSVHSEDEQVPVSFLLLLLLLHTLVCSEGWYLNVGFDLHVPRHPIFPTFLWVIQVFCPNAFLWLLAGLSWLFCCLR